MLQDLTIGVIAVNQEEFIVGYNRSAANLLGDRDLIGKPFKGTVDKTSTKISIEELIFDANNTNIYKLYHLRTKADNDRDFFKLVLENCYDEIFVSDVNTANLYVNPTIERHYNIDRKDIINSIDYMFSNSLIKNSPVYITLETKRPATIEIKTSTDRDLLISTKPVFDDSGEIKFVVGTARDISELRKVQEELSHSFNLVKKYENVLKKSKDHKSTMENQFIYSSETMKNLITKVDRIAKVDSTVLITGKSGTGKSHIAQHIHSISQRKKGPFVTINCTTIPDSLIESELFGYVPGAFTGASKKGKDGLVTIAHKGTLFLDEIGELSHSIQAKLLLFIQKQEFLPVGSTETKHVDVRIITATNKDLKELISKSTFREDLYYRLNVVEVKVPALKDRKEDIIPLLMHYLKNYDNKYNFNHRLSEDSVDKLLAYPWPGNIRELQNIIENLVVTTLDHVIEPRHFPYQFFEEQPGSLQEVENFPLNFNERVKAYEKLLFTKAYYQNSSTYKVGKALGISQSKVMRLIKKYL
ncbi:MAG: sigma 54-interacting transcriptional regulator [Spirochaetales bacterium]|nr:sigma 54-interacting transcriptional regulator [Spirochaetales bacterium]